MAGWQWLKAVNIGVYVLWAWIHVLDDALSYLTIYCSTVIKLTVCFHDRPSSTTRQSKLCCFPQRNKKMDCLWLKPRLDLDSTPHQNSDPERHPFTSIQIPSVYTSRRFALNGLWFYSGQKTSGPRPNSPRCLTLPWPRISHVGLSLTLMPLSRLSCNYWRGNVGVSYARFYLVVLIIFSVTSFAFSITKVRHYTT
jgi:hypothetical protein